mgnify:CR=1 FL=1
MRMCSSLFPAPCCPSSCTTTISVSRSFGVSHGIAWEHLYACLIMDVDNVQ